MKFATATCLLLASAAGVYTFSGTGIATSGRTSNSTGISPVLLITDDSTTVNYQLPVVNITGPTGAVPLGKFTALQASMVSKPQFLYSITYVWRINPSVGTMIFDSDGSQVTFGTGVDQGVTHTAELLYVCCYAQKTGSGQYINPASKVGITNFSFTTEGTAVPRPVPPNPLPPGPVPPNPLPPGPAPAPPVPAAKFGLGPLAVTWGALVNLDAPTKKLNAAALAASFSTTSKAIDTSLTKIASGQAPDIANADQALAAVTASNNTAVPTGKAVWMPWFVALEAKLKTLSLTELADLRDAFAEIAVGLQALAT